MPNEPLRFEEVLKELERVVTHLESGRLSLEESIAAFESGVRLSRQGASMLDDAERKIEMLLRDENGAERVAPFEPPESSESSR